MILPDDWDWKNPNYDTIYEQRQQRLTYLREHPEILLRLKEYYASNPVEFINDWGNTVDPRLAERGQRTVIPFILFPKQEEFIDWAIARWRMREDGVVEKSRDMGVTWLCVAAAVWMALFIPGSVAGIGSRKEEYVDKIGDPKSIFWKIREFINLLPREFQPYRWDAAKDAPHMRCLNHEKGSSIIGEAGDSIGRGNRSSIYFVDEAAFLERPDQVDAALSQTSNCRIHVSTPNGTGNPFYRKAHDGRTPKFVFDWRDDPRKDEAWYEEQKRKLDPVVIAQEIDRSYTASVANAYIPGELAQAAARRGPMDVQPTGPVMIGVDMARFGNDLSVISVRQGRVLLFQKTYSKCDGEDVAGYVIDTINQLHGEFHQVAVDGGGGYGGGVVDILRRKYPKYKIVEVHTSKRLNDGEHYNLRARMARDVKEWLKNGASIPNDGDLISDISALQYTFRAGELLLESKDDAKKRGIKSPDRYDSLALTFAVPPQLDVDEFDAPITAHPLWQALDEIAGF